MKKNLRKSNVVKSTLSLCIIGIFIVFATGSLFLLDAVPIERELIYVGDREYQLTTEYTQYYEVKTGQRDQYGRWTGPIKYQRYDYNDNLVYTCEYTLKLTHYHGVYKVTNRYGAITREDCYDLGERVPCNKSSLMIISDNSAFSVMEENYSWYLDYFYGFEIEKDFMQSYFDTLETILYSDNFDFSEFDDYYDDALSAIEETRFDTLTQINTIFHYIDGTELLKNSEFRLALIDQYYAGKTSSYEVVEEVYPNYLIKMNNSGISNDTFKIFCHDFDSIMATYGKLDPEDPFFTDSVDERSSRTLTAILDDEQEKSSSAVLIALKSAEIQKNIDLFRKGWRPYNSVQHLLSVNPGSQDVALVIFVFMLTEFENADKVKQSVKEAFILKKGLITLPTVTTNIVEDDSETSVTLTGNVIKDGGAEVTSRGIVWANFHNPDINQEVIEAGSGTGTFSVTLEDLTPGKAYYARAFAQNSEGIAYGNNISFSTVTTGLDQLEEDRLNIKVYPNPAVDAITIKFQTEMKENVEINIMDMQGRIIYNYSTEVLNLGVYEHPIDLSSFESGIYNCRIISEGKMETKKIMIVK